MGDWSDMCERFGVANDEHALDKILGRIHGDDDEPPHRTSDRIRNDQSAQVGHSNSAQSGTASPQNIEFRIAGISYYQSAASLCRAGDSVELTPEPTNPYDPNAVVIHCRDRKIGYVPRTLAPRVKNFLLTNTTSAVIVNVLGERRDDFNMGLQVRISSC